MTGRIAQIITDSYPLDPNYDLTTNRYCSNISAAIVSHRHIGADSMGAIALTAKKLWRRCPQIAPIEIFYECVILQVTKGALISA